MISIGYWVLGIGYWVLGSIKLCVSLVLSQEHWFVVSLLTTHNQKRTKNGGQQSLVVPEILDSMGNDPHVAYPGIMKILQKINSNVYYYPRGFQWLVYMSVYVCALICFCILCNCNMCAFS